MWATDSQPTSFIASVHQTPKLRPKGYGQPDHILPFHKENETNKAEYQTHPNPYKHRPIHPKTINLSAEKLYNRENQTLSLTTETT